MTGTMPRARREHGTIGLEYGALIVVAAIVVSGIAFGVTNSGFSGKVAAAVCRLFMQEGCASWEEGSTQTPLEQALSGNYVAMGDSFASGEGTYNYADGTDYDNRDDWNPANWGDDAHNRCHRSNVSYAQQIYGGNHFNGSLATVYCSGAETPEFTNDNPANDGEGPQVDALNEDTSLVTLSIGGNDLGFADVIKDCALNGERGVPFMDTCQEKWDQELDQRLIDLKPELVALYEDIKKRSPNARIIVMGYPPLFNEPPSEPLSNLLFVEDQLWMNSKATMLNAMLREACREAGVEFIDPTSAFIGHGVGSDDQWINDLDWGGPGLALTDPGSFHPNALGHDAMAQLLQEQLENPQYP